MILHALSNQEIDEYFKGNRLYGGCYSKDQLPKKIQNKFIIINLQDNDEGNGTHWVAIVNTIHDMCTYFDSYGVMPPVEIQEYMLSSDKPKVNTFPYHLQDIGSSACGWYCIYVIEQYLLGKHEKDIIKYFSDDPKRNDRVIANYFKQTNHNKKLGGNLISDAFTGAYDRTAYMLSRQWQRTPKIRYFLKAYGDVRILNIRVCRKPIQSVIRKLGNLATFGQLNKRVKQLGYDQVFHLFSVIRLANGINVKLEKNQVVQIHTMPQNFDVDPETTDWAQVRLTAATTLNQIFDNLEKTFNKERIYRYSGFSTNCQRFIMDVLISSKAEDIESLQQFIMQDAAKLISEGYLQSMANNVTDFAGNATVALSGGSIVQNNKIYNGI